MCDRSGSHEETGVQSAASPPEHATPGLGLWSAGHQSGGDVHQTDGPQICKDNADVVNP